MSRNRASPLPAPPRAALGETLDRVLTGRVCVLGIGNRARGDDAVGALLAGALREHLGALAIDAGSVPENYLGKVLATQPDTILLVDAIDFGAPAGSVAVLAPEKLRATGLSTHALSLGMAHDYLAARSGARLVVLGIQPQQLAPGGGLSAPVAAALATLGQDLAGRLAPLARQEGAHDED